MMRISLKNGSAIIGLPQNYPDLSGNIHKSPVAGRRE
jgi:hypothetical protein